MFLNNTPVTGQTNFNRYMPSALPGMKSGIGDCIVLPHVNDVGTVDTFTLTPPTTVNNASIYFIEVGSARVEFLTNSTTAADLMLELYQAMLLDPIFYSNVDVALKVTTNVITVSSRSVGTVLSVITNTNLANPIVVAKTVSTSQNKIIPFGRFVGRKTTYKFDQLEGVSSATLIDAASGYTALGVTLCSSATEKVGRYHQAQSGYDFGYTMNVLRNTGTIKGVWVECVESDIVYGDSAYIAVSAGNEGKISKVSTNNVNATSFVKIVSATQVSFDKKIILVEVKL